MLSAGSWLPVPMLILINVKEINKGRDGSSMMVNDPVFCRPLGVEDIGLHKYAPGLPTAIQIKFGEWQGGQYATSRG